MKKLISVLLFLVYFLTSIVYLNLYEFKNVRNILWKNNDVSKLCLDGIKKVNTPEQLINKLEAVAEKNNLNIYKIRYQEKSKIGKRKIKIYTTLNDNVFENLKIYKGRLLNKENASYAFISSENTDDANQVGQVNFFNLSSELNIYNLSGILYDGESLGCWFVNTTDKTKITLLKKDLMDALDCKDIEFYTSQIDESQSMENNDLKYRMVGVLIMLYILTFLTIVYWLFSRYKEFAVKKMFGESDISLRLKIIFKELFKYHLYGFSLAGLIILGFLAFKVEIRNLSGFCINYFIFNLKLTVISLGLMLIPLILIKYIKIPLMLKNKKPVKVIKNINTISKCLIGIATITVIINSNNNLYLLIKEVEHNQVWNNATNYAIVKSSAAFSGTIPGYDDEDEVDELDHNIKKWFQICNAKGAIYINVRNHMMGSSSEDNFEENNLPKDEFAKIGAKSIKVNNNYLQLNPIYDVNGKQINIPDHYEHTLNLLVPQNLKKYESNIKEKYEGEFYNNGWQDYKLNIIYIKDNQKCFTYKIGWAPETQNYVIGSLIQVISNNNMHIDSYGCCWCNGFYPKINNIDNPYQELLPDIKACGADKQLSRALTLYETAAQDIYKTQQQFLYTIELMIFAILTIIVLIISSSINYLEENKLINMVKKLHGVGFMKRNTKFLILNSVIWCIGIILMLVMNYNNNLIDKIAFLFYLPIDMILIRTPAPWVPFTIQYINWSIVFGVIVLDIIISTIMLKIYENKKISSVLKGE